MNRLHPLQPLVLRSRIGDIKALVPLDFRDIYEGTLVIEVDAGIVETFLHDVPTDDAQESLCKEALQSNAWYEMPVIDTADDGAIYWAGNPYFLRQLRKIDIGASSVAFIVTQSALTALMTRWPFDDISFFR